MLTSMRWSGITAGVASLLAVALAVPARADITDPVNCITNPTIPACVITVEQPNDSVGGGGGGSSGCRDRQGQTIPCNIPGKGWYGGDGCWYQRAEGVDLGAAEALGGKVAPPDAWYVGSCGDPITNFWPASFVRYAVFGADLGVELLAQEAVRHLRLPAPQIRLSPDAGAPQVVYVPTWMWVDEAVWSPRSATASLSGLSVTAVGTPLTVAWSTGDGRSLQCGKGTPWTASRDPASASPDCGHTYTTPSRAGTYTVTATITWRVTWSGGGVAGTEPDVTSTASVPVQVVEASAVNTTS
ncbi:hypothetical protein [Micromonospora sp. WMMD1082]|uniref:hypothetical protein n=1 Tax=Micromonospora sp. WMMD1082 TaxID=3016104 RepID=UPI002416B9E4|nr:hypothetical protein [Micromonospora sp. WMMD1082]MDG4795441.1 hypothetical protein [Micromonospora sp. WMMD1082]